jgi:hypothetical protein
MVIVETSPNHVVPRTEELGVGAASDTSEREMGVLEDLLSKLNPMVEEFVQCVVEE